MRPVPRRRTGPSSPTCCQFPASTWLLSRSRVVRSLDSRAFFPKPTVFRMPRARHAVLPLLLGASESASAIGQEQTFALRSALRDPTRSGLVTVMQEIAHATGFTALIREDAILVRPQVRAACEMLEYAPLYLDCEGRVVGVLSAETARKALNLWLSLPNGETSAVIGSLSKSAPQEILQTGIGGERILEELEDDSPPRIR